MASAMKARTIYSKGPKKKGSLKFPLSLGLDIEIDPKFGFLSRSVYWVQNQVEFSRW